MLTRVWEMGADASARFFARVLSEEAWDRLIDVARVLLVHRVRGARDLDPCTARATLREVIDGRKLLFDVDVVEGDRVIGVGTHQRRVVDVRGS